jgi:hypothetical protein
MCGGKKMDKGAKMQICNSEQHQNKATRSRTSSVFDYTHMKIGFRCAIMTRGGLPNTPAGEKLVVGAEFGSKHRLNGRKTRADEVALAILGGE